MVAVIQNLMSFQRGDIFRHLRALSAQDLRLRFGRFMDEAALEKYVDEIDFLNDKVFGIYERGLLLVGMGHLAINFQSAFAELGVSVDPAHRRKGYGESLLKRAVFQASSLGIRRLYTHCRSENQAMMHLAAKAGLRAVAIPGDEAADASPDAPRWGKVTMIPAQITLADHLFRQQARKAVPSTA